MQPLVAISNGDWSILSGSESITLITAIRKKLWLDWFSCIPVLHADNAIHFHSKLAQRELRRLYPFTLQSFTRTSWIGDLGTHCITIVNFGPVSFALCPNSSLTVPRQLRLGKHHNIRLEFHVRNPKTQLLVTEQLWKRLLKLSINFSDYFHLFYRLHSIREILICRPLVCVSCKIVSSILHHCLRLTELEFRICWQQTASPQLTLDMFGFFRLAFVMKIFNAACFLAQANIMKQFSKLCLGPKQLSWKIHCRSLGWSMTANKSTN